MIPAGLYRPDVADSNAGVTDNIRNVLMTKDENGVSYGPHPRLAVPVPATSLGAAPRGGLKVVTRAGTHKTFFGTAAKVRELGTDFSWSDTGTGYGLATADNWGRLHFNDVALWSNLVDGLLNYDIETPAGLSAVSGAPSFKHLAKVFDSVLGMQSDGDPRTFHLSATNSYMEYVLDGARNQTLTQGGDIMGAGELSQGYAVLFQRQAVNLLQRTFDRSRFTRVVMSNEIGAASAESIVCVNGAAYFLSDTGFQKVTPGGIVNIGKDKVNRTFINSLVGELGTVEGIYDPIFNRILWRFQGKNGDPAIFDQILVYDIDMDEFGGLIDEQTSALLAVGTIGYTADNAGDLGTVDTVPYGPDSRFWKGGDRRVLALDEDYKAGYFDGANLAASVDTASQVSGTSDLVTSLTPSTDAVNATVALGVKDRLADSFTWKVPETIKASGRVPVRGRGKIVRGRIAVAAGESWSFIRGVNFPKVSPGGPK